MSSENTKHRGGHRLNGIGEVNTTILHRKRIADLLFDNLHIGPPSYNKSRGAFDMNPPIYLPSRDGFSFVNELEGLGVFLVNDEAEYGDLNDWSLVKGYTPAKWRETGLVIVNTQLSDLANLADVTGQLAARKIGTWSQEDIFDAKSQICDFLLNFSVIKGKVNILENFRQVWNSGAIPEARRRLYSWIATNHAGSDNRYPSLTLKEVAHEKNQATRVGELLSDFLDLDGYDQTRNAEFPGEDSSDNKGIDMVLFPSKQLSQRLETAVIYVQLKGCEKGVEEFREESIKYHKRRHLPFGLEWQKGKMVVLKVNDRTDNKEILIDFLIQLANYYYVLEYDEQLESFIQHVAPDALPLFYDPQHNVTRLNKSVEELIKRRKLILTWAHGMIN